MADRMWAQIEIGGPIPRNLLPELNELLAAEAFDEGGERIEGGEVFNASACEVAWGHFEQLEDFLIKHEISFDRRCDPKYEYSGEWRRYRPDVADHSYVSDQNGHPVWRWEDIEKAASQVSCVDASYTGIIEPLRKQLFVHEFKDLEPITLTGEEE